ncbi:MAG: tetratricopeptide repeat protein [Reyranellaceae bacterium]
MSARCKRAVAFLVLLLSSYPIAAHAGPYEDGDAAFRARNYAAAFKLWQPLADDGHAEAQLGVATLYYSGLGVVMDYDLAFEWFSKAAAQGLPRANYMLGAMYRDGRGVREDHDKAIAYLRKAADEDVQGAQYSLGLMYLIGKGMDLDYSEAYFWLSLAVTSTITDSAQLTATAAHLRDEAKSKLTAQQITELDRRVAERKIAQAR